MQGPATPTQRVLGAMLLAHQFDHNDICVMGYVQDVSKNSKQFSLQTTDKKTIPVVLAEPLSEYLDGLVQIRGRFDGQRIQCQSYNQLLNEIRQDFDTETYNEAVKQISGKGF